MYDAPFNRRYDTGDALESDNKRHDERHDVRLDGAYAYAPPESQLVRVHAGTTFSAHGSPTRTAASPCTGAPQARQAPMRSPPTAPGFIRWAASLSSRRGRRVCVHTLAFTQPGGGVWRHRNMKLSLLPSSPRSYHPYARVGLASNPASATVTFLLRETAEL
jgi:hypothetical protein